MRLPHLRTPPRDTLLFALALVVLYIVLMAAKLALWRANVLMNDWAFYNNSFWNTNFRDLWLSSHDRLVQFGYVSYLNEHFGPLLLVVAALYQVVPQPEIMLLAVHGASPILAAIFIRATAIEVLGDRRLAAIIALAYALSPGMLWPTMSMVYGFQPDGWLPPLAAMLGWALATRRTAVYFVALGLMLGIKENVPAYGAILGACLMLFTDRKRQGVATIVVSLAVFAVASIGVPAITGVENRNVGRVWTFIDNVIHLRPSFDYTLAELLVFVGYSLAFLPALYVWPFLAMLGPDALLIGQVSYAKTVTWHVMLPVTVLGVASVYGSARILTTRYWPAAFDARFTRARLLRGYWTAVLAVSLIAGPATIWVAYDRYIALASPVDRAAIARAQALVPPEAGVVVTSDVEQYFVRRRVVTSRPEIVGVRPDAFTYAVVNRRSLTPGRREGPLAGVARQDACLIATAEQMARAGGALMDEGGILVVRAARMPKPEC
ncbi:MAG: DUF2079 domain-containing protein [Pseudolabrys sp.]